MLMYVFFGLAVLAVVIIVGFAMARGSREARQRGADRQPTGHVNVIERR
jgi:ABC-type transporter Mla subunit MlaD